VMIASAMGANVIAVDIRDEALAMATAVGAAQVVNARKQDHLTYLLREMTGGGAHVSLDTLGSLETCRNSILSLRKRGRHVQVGLMVADYKDAPVPMNQVIAKELEILGSHGMQAHAYAPMMQMILSQRLQPKKLIGKTVTLEQSLAELQAMGSYAGTGVTVITEF
jgi:alcohol dehydrogenase